MKLKSKNLTAHVQQKANLANVTFIVSPTGLFYEIKGERVPAKTFEHHNKLILQKNNNAFGESLDSRRNFY